MIRRLQRTYMVPLAMAASVGAQSFTMWPIVDSAALATSLGVSQTCVNALNATVNCDADLFRMAGQIDVYFWSGDNITSLCTSDCIQSSSEWLDGVLGSCNPTDSISMDSKLVPIDTVALRYADGVGLACLTDRQLGIANNLTSSDPTGGNGTAPTPALAFAPPYSNATLDTNGTAPSDVPSPNVTYEYNYDPSPNYCFNQSQLWVGVDLPDCDEDPSDPLCSDPDNAMRLANYYNNTVLCDPCFLSVMWWRINSPFLPDSDHSDYMIEQYQDILDVCSVIMPDTVVRQLPSYAAAPSPTYLPPGTDPAGNNTSGGSQTCAGQSLASSGMSCNDISQKYGVTTGDLHSASGTDDCSFSGTLCLPAACSVAQLGSNITCDSFSASLSTSSVNVTDSLFLSWNPNIQGLCDALAAGQYVCTGPPGGAFTLPPPILGSNTTASGQNRGGGDSGSNPNGPLGPNGPSTNSTATAPTQVGIDANCSLFAYAVANSTCYDFSVAFNITLKQLTKWNPVLGYPDGHNCTTQFWAGYDYCVEVPGEGGGIPTTTTTSSSPTSTLPYPTQTGIDPNCNKYAEAMSGDYCSKFAQDNGITTDQLYAWNKALGDNGANCGSAFFAGYDYCVGVAGQTTSPTTSAPAPTPTQSGIAANCDKLVVAKSGDYCYKFASDNGITTAELYEWNTVLGPNGENCNTQFQAGYGYCVSVNIPTQPGIASNCNKLVVAHSGDYCYKFASDNGISTTQLYQWNPVLGSNGENCNTQFQAGYGYCVSVS